MQEPRAQAAHKQDIFTGGGELGRLIGAHDWAGTPLGAPAGWPSSLRTAARIMLSSRYAMWLGWGPDLRFLYNDAYAPTLGVKHPWAIGRPAREVWAEIWDAIGPRAQSVIETGVATWDEGLLLFLERSGFPEETYHTFSYSPLPGDHGGIAGKLCVVTEETERVIGERQLATLRDLAAGLADAQTEDVVWREACAVLSANPRDLPFALVYLFDEDGVAQRVCASGFAGEHAAAPAAIGADNPVWPAAEIRTGSGSLTIGDLASRFAGLPQGRWDKPPLRARLVPLPQRGQVQPAGFLLVGLNPYRAPDDSYFGFVDLVAGQLASGLANARAYAEERQRAEALAAIDRAKTQFFSNVSHEFRTPLTLMLAPLQEALAAPEPELAAGTRSLIGVAHRNGQRLLKLVNSLLDFSRIEAGRQQGRYQPTDLARLTADLASTFRSACDKAGLFLKVETPPLGEPAHVDRDMWEKIVLNLLSNAFKFTLAGGITVTLRRRGRTVELAVADTGVGIPAPELPKLFERFHRVENAGGRSFEGSGIGLSLVRELAQLHGGEVAVESTPGRGSCFRVTVPLGTAHLPADRVDPESGEPAPVAARAEAFVEEALRSLPDGERNAEAELELPSVGGRVLLADDNADMRDYVCRLLVQQGYEVAVATDGEAALAAAAAHPPDLVLSDVMMPRLDGFGLLKALRADPHLADIPVLLLSARAGEEARVEGLSAGADDYLIKPFAARELVARVGSAVRLGIDRRRSNAALREEARLLEILNRVGSAVAAELSLDRAVQIVTDAATELTGAAFGSFFYNVQNEAGESYWLYSLSGVPREAFSKFPMPRNTAVFAPTFAGQGVVRVADIKQDSRYGKNDPHFGMPKGHLPVTSYLAAPVIARSGEVLGGLFFGHPEANIFTERAERIVVGIAAQAAIAIDNARLYQAAQKEIAQRQRVEDELTRLNETLEARVEQRTEELASANRKLIDQIEERERVEATLRQMQRLEAVGQLTSGVAHDFNNLLTVVLGNLDFLQRTLQGTDERVLQRLSYMRAAAERGARLTTQLLAFSRRQKLDTRQLDLNETVAAMRDLLQSTIGGQVKLLTNLAEDLWPALVDPTQIELVILNLAINGRDAMEVGGSIAIDTANVHIASRPQRPEEPEPGDYVVLSITDTGSGMSDEVLAKAFEPFFTTKEVGKGSGLGLAQVYGFAKQSGGGVRIDTRLGHGTSVKVYLPRAAGEMAMAAVPADRTESAPVGHPRRATILLVDDDPAVREITGSLLEEHGYQVVQAGNGATALAVLRDRPSIDLLLVDFAMPGMNGAEVAVLAKRQRPELPVVYVTGYADLAALEGVSDERIVRKPYQDNELARKLAAALEAAGAAPRARQSASA